jgi:hypothetical protein
VARESVERAVAETIADEVRGVDEIKGEAELIYERYRARLQELAQELNEELAPLDARLATLQQAVREKMEDLDPDLPPVPEGETAEEPDDENWLFDGRRSYLEQLPYYKER